MNLSREEKMILISILGMYNEASFASLMAKYAKVDQDISNAWHACLQGYDVSFEIYKKMRDTEDFELTDINWKILLVALADNADVESKVFPKYAGISWMLYEDDTQHYSREEFLKLSERVKTEPEIVENLLNSLENKFGKVGEYGS